MLKKFLALLLVIVMTATVAIGGTVAYLTAQADPKLNVFTVGDIDIELDEEVGTSGTGSVDQTEGGASYEGVMPGDKLKKEVTISNTGSSPAYVRAIVLINNADKINAAIDDVYGDSEDGGTSQEMYNLIFDGWGINQAPRDRENLEDDARGVIDGTYGLPNHVDHVDFSKTTAGSTLIGIDNWFIAGSEKAGQYWVDGPKAYDGYYTAHMDDYEICYAYYMRLEPGESTVLFNGLNVPAEWDEDQLAMFEGLNIEVYADAIQAANFDEAKDAFEALEAEHPWASARMTTVSTADELTDALADGGSAVLTDDVKATAPVYVTGGTLNGNGNTIDFTGVKTTAWPNAYGVTLGNGGSTVENLTVTNAGYAIGSTATTDDVYIKNVTTDYVTYALNGNGNNTNSVYVTDSNINGWISYSNIKKLSFDNCKLAKGNSYAGYLVVYGETSFEDCTFEEFGMCARLQDGSVVAAGKTVSFTNCSYVTDSGTVKVTAGNFKDLFTDGDDADFDYLSQCNVVIDGVTVSWQ